VVARGELVDDAEFERCKNALLEHLQGFRRDRNRHEEEIVAAIARVDRLGIARLSELIISGEEIPDLPNAPATRVRAERATELQQQWAGIRSWFIGSGRTRSPWDVQGEKVIQGALAEAKRRIEERKGRPIGPQKPERDVKQVGARPGSRSWPPEVASGRAARARVTPGARGGADPA